LTEKIVDERRRRQGRRTKSREEKSEGKFIVLLGSSFLKDAGSLALRRALAAKICLLLKMPKRLGRLVIES
jgi:hypothetical protein